MLSTYLTSPVNRLRSRRYRGHWYYENQEAENVRCVSGTHWNESHMPYSLLTLFGSRTMFLSALVSFTAPSDPPEAIMGWKGEPSTVYTWGIV